VWSIRRLAVNGLGTGATPDILNFYRNGTQNQPVWQLNGNSWGVTFGRSELVLMPGEQLMAVSLGSMTSTAQISVTGEAVEVPALMIGRLL